MIELIPKNIIVGALIVIINLIPLIFRKYKLLYLTSVISIILALLGIYAF